MEELMSTERIRNSIETAIDYLSQHPNEARYTDSLATAELEEGLRFRIVDPEGRKLVSDMPESIGGGNEAPSPGWLLRAAIASCTATLTAMRAAQLKVQLTELKVLVDSESDDHGILGMEESIPAGPLSVRIRFHILADGASERELREVVDWAVKHCPVTDALQRDIPLTTEVEFS